MRRLFILILFYFLGLNTFLIAQVAKEGIYLSVNDFNTGKISYQKIQHKKYKLKLHTAFNSSKIQVTIGDSNILLNKNSVFGYRDKKNNTYRFYRENNYLILNPKENLLLYSTSSLGGYKHTQTITSYFFSLGSNAPLISLTKQNLKIMFSEDLIFQELLDANFYSDESLIEYDQLNKAYKLNKIESSVHQLKKINKQE